VSLGMRKLSVLVTAFTTAMDSQGDIIDFKMWQKTSYTGRYPRLVGPDYSATQPVLKRGKRRTRALKRANVVNYHDELANLYGCHPCPNCGEVRDRAAFRRPHGLIIECTACGDERPARH